MNPGLNERHAGGGGTSPLRDGASLHAVVALACTCAFMAVMDTSIVNVALPSIREALQLSSGGQQWVIDAYLLTLGGFVLLGARVSDLFGRRRVLGGGIIVFVLASLVGGLAGSGPMLIAARAAQGVGGSVLAPSGLALIIATHPEGELRAKAMSLYAASAAVAVAAGVLIGGVLTQELSWRWVMFVNVPIGVGLSVAVRRLLVPNMPGARRGHLDGAGAVMVTIGIGALIEGLSEAQRSGWGATLTLLALGLAIVLLSGFIVIETRVSDPLVRLAVFRLPGVAAGNLIIACVGTVLTASTFFISLVLQSDLGFDALGAGLRLVPLAVVSGVVSLVSPRAVRHFGPRPVLLVGLCVAAAGYLWLGLIGGHPTYLADLFGPLVVIGVGLGLTIMPSTRAAAAAVPPQETGLAAGLFNVSRQIGAAVGIAALVTLAVARTHAKLHVGVSVATAQLRGDATALLACAGICLLAGLISLLLPRRAA